MHIPSHNSMQSTAPCSNGQAGSLSRGAHCLSQAEQAAVAQAGPGVLVWLCTVCCSFKTVSNLAARQPEGFNLFRVLHSMQPLNGVPGFYAALSLTVTAALTAVVASRWCVVRPLPFSHHWPLQLHELRHPRCCSLAGGRTRQGTSVTRPCNMHATP
jgi:hypothetical protein